MRFFSAVSCTHTNRHGCLLAPLGAVVAARTHHSIVSRETGLSENSRTVRRVRMIS